MVLAVVSECFAPQTASAESTLEKILSAKKIRVAIDVANPPFGILDKSGQPDDRTSLSLARWRRTGRRDRIRSSALDRSHTGVAGGRADVTIASISITTDRAKAVMYCNPNGALSITIFAPQSVNIKTPADLVGKRVGITRATLEEATVPKMAPEGTRSSVR